jgi:hypothetical protein
MKKLFSLGTLLLFCLVSLVQYARQIHVLIKANFWIIFKKYQDPNLLRCLVNTNSLAISDSADIIPAKPFQIVIVK